MRAVVQRVSRAQVTVAGEQVGAIAGGLCVLVGVARGDEERDATWLAEKVCLARVFSDAEGKMNRSLVDEGLSMLAVSQFTLLGDLRRGRRPSFSEAMEPEGAARLFQAFCGECRKRGVLVETGRFRAEMEVELVNTGPVTLLLDSKRLF